MPSHLHCLIRTAILAGLFLGTAAQSAQSALSENPDALAAYRSGVALLDAGDVDAAIVALETATRKDRGFAQAFNARAKAYMARNTLLDRLKWVPVSGGDNADIDRHFPN